MRSPRLRTFTTSSAFLDMMPEPNALKLLRLEVERLTAAREAVLTLHARQERAGLVPWCSHCVSSYPCATVKALG